MAGCVCNVESPLPYDKNTKITHPPVTLLAMKYVCSW